MDKFKELIKSFLGTKLEDEDIAKASELSEAQVEELEPALNILEEYREDFNDDVLGAIQDLAKYALQNEEEVDEIDFVAELTNLEKAGASLSKATIAQLKKIGEIINGMIGAKEAAVKKGTKKEDAEKLSPEVIAQLEELQKFKDKEEAETAQKTLDDAIAEKMTPLQEKLDELEKANKKKPTKKSITGQEGDEEPDEKKGDDDEEEFQWGSLTGATEEE